MTSQCNTTITKTTTTARNECTCDRVVLAASPSPSATTAATIHHCWAYDELAFAAAPQPLSAASYSTMTTNTTTTTAGHSTKQHDTERSVDLAVTARQIAGQHPSMATREHYDAAQQHTNCTFDVIEPPNSGGVPKANSDGLAAAAPHSKWSKSETHLCKAPKDGGVAGSSSSNAGDHKNAKKTKSTTATKCGLMVNGGGCASVDDCDDTGAANNGGHKLAVFNVVSLNDLNEEDADPMVMATRPMNDLSKNRRTLNNISNEEMHLMRETMKR